MRIPSLHLPEWLDGFRRPLQIGLMVAILVAVCSVFVRNSYKSQATLLPVSSGNMGALGSLADAAAAFGVGVPGKSDGGANFDDILQSRWMAESLLQAEYCFHEKSWRFGADHEFKRSLMDYLDEENLDRAVKSLGGVFSASEDKQSGVVTISMETKSPDLSQAVVRRAVALLEGYVQESGRTRGGFKAKFTAERLEEARKELSQAEDEFRRFQEGNRAYQASADPAVRLKGARLENEYRLRQQLVSTLALNREQALMEEKNDVPILNVLDPGNLPLEKSGPKRGLIVLLGLILASAGAWAWLNREWIRERLLEEQPGGERLERMEEK